MDTLFWQVIESPKLSIDQKVDREFFIFLFLSRHKKCKKLLTRFKMMYILKTIGIVSDIFNKVNYII